MNQTNEITLRAIISALVPLRVTLMAEETNGPTAEEWERAKAINEKWGTGDDGRIMWDVLIAGYGGEPTQEERRDLRVMTRDLIFALAVMAWCPGGVTFLGLHIEAPVVWSVEIVEGLEQNVISGKSARWPWPTCEAKEQESKC